MAASCCPHFDSPENLPINKRAASPLGRHIAFGDGVFETVLLHHGAPVNWPDHKHRLASGCYALGLDAPDLSQLESQLVSQHSHEWAALKIVVWRKRLARGYSPHTGATELEVELETIESPINRHWSNGIEAELCAAKLAVNPAIAGIKHLNRLEQVRARDELQRRRVVEGLLLDSGGNLIEGSMSNLFLVSRGQLITPDLNGAGVAGIMRQAIIREFGASIKRVTLADFYRADEAFVCNSLIGVWPIKKLGCHFKSAWPLTEKVQNWIKNRLYA